MDDPAVEPLEQPLGAADRGVERHVLAGGVAVEGDVHVVDPGAGHHDSFCDRTQRLTERPTGSPGSSLALTSCSVAEPHTRITRDPGRSAGAMTASARVDTEQERSPRYPRVRGNRCAKRAASAA